MSGTWHVPDDDIRISRNVAAQMARNKTSIKIVTAPRRGTDDDFHRPTLVEHLDGGLRQSGGQQQCPDGQGKAGDTRGVRHQTLHFTSLAHYHFPPSRQEWQTSMPTRCYCYVKPLRTRSLCVQRLGSCSDRSN